MDLDANHVGFVLIAYAVTAVVLVGLALVLAIDIRRQRAKVSRLDDGSGRRRRRASGQAASP